ncbi:sigma-70 family RNA polymerase sigma factor [Faecalicatena orotica]|nr:sigma-70 family RNA polymerase sigma factor [Faecalicatena orotica]
MTDKKLLHLLDQNPEEGMGLLMEQYMGLLWSACRLYLTNPEDIRECVQETFADFYGNRERFRTEKGTIKAYLYVIAKRKAIRMAAQNGKQSMVPLEMLEEAAADSGEDAILNREALEQALGKLKEQDSRMIRMQYYDGLTCREIAEAMHLPVETVKKRQQRSLKKLRLALIALVALGILGACAAAVIRVRFNPVTGIRDAEEEIYRGTTLPLEVETEYGRITVEYAIWQEQYLYVKMTVVHPEEVDGFDIVRENIWAESEDGTHLRGSGSSGQDLQNGLLILDWDFHYYKPQEQFLLHLFDRTITLQMVPLTEYDDLDTIGKPVTHKERTVVVSGDWEDEDTLKLNAWCYAKGIWKICKLGEWPVSVEEMGKESYVNWMLDGLDGSGSFTAEVKTQQGKPYQLTIPAVCLKAELGTEGPIFEIPIPGKNESEEVDIPFEVGEDRYHIVRIERKLGEPIEAAVDEESPETDTEESSEIRGTIVTLYVEPITLEKNTKLSSIYISWGDMEEQKSYRLNQDTGKLELTGSEWEFNPTGSTFIPSWYLDGEYAEYRQELTVGYGPGEEVPEKTMVRVDKVIKTWEQEYGYTIK